MEIGKSLFEENQLQNIKEIMKIAKENNVKIHLPKDFVCASEMKEGVKTTLVTVDQGIPKDLSGFDIGP